MKFNECPKCGAPPGSYDEDPVYLDYPAGAKKHIETIVTVQFGCHKIKNVAQCASNYRKELIEEIYVWETKSTL
jgi:hypothetical protein